LQLQNINKTVAVAGYAPQKQGGKTHRAQVALQNFPKMLLYQQKIDYP
jgi:hypothetical protein